MTNPAHIRTYEELQQHNEDIEHEELMKKDPDYRRAAEALDELLSLRYPGNV